MLVSSTGWGEAFAYPGLHVVDGSVMPGPVGPNPSLTIAAFAERAVAHIVWRSRLVTYRLEFTEKMIGAFTFGESDYHAGTRAGAGLMFRLTIATDDVDAFVADPRHLAVPQGYVDSDALGGRRTVEAGTFNLFVDEGAGTRHMLYRLYFSDATGRPRRSPATRMSGPGPSPRLARNLDAVHPVPSPGMYP